MFMISEKFVHLSHVKLSHIHCHFSKTNQFMFGQNCWSWQFCSQPFFGGIFSLKQAELFTSFFPNLVFICQHSSLVRSTNISLVRRYLGHSVLI